ncbi:MAG TPA: choice-of-anchor Q domain-containing protein [Polyangiaceae bacterium]
MKRSQGSSVRAITGQALRVCATWCVGRAGSIALLGAGCVTISCGTKQVIHVTTVEDGGSGSLRAAIATVNADPESDYRIADNAGAETLQLSELLTSASVAIAPEEAPTAAVCASGVVTDASSSDNWFSNSSCGLPQNETNEQTSAAFLLGALADNGGPVPTVLPGAGSVLIDRIPLERCTQPLDARGVERPQGEACDIGAVEQSSASNTLRALGSTGHQSDQFGNGG